MGITDRRKHEKAKRRKVIIESAKELILFQGIQNVSMKNIAYKAELSKATVYLYFSNKEILFNEICGELALCFLEHAMRIKEAGFSGIEALKQLWRSYVNLFGNSNDIIIAYHIHNFLSP